MWAELKLPVLNSWPLLIHASAPQGGAVDSSWQKTLAVNVQVLTQTCINHVPCGAEQRGWGRQT
jgi:hypothetical protein